MKRTILLTTGLVFILTGWAFAQGVPPPPTPVGESDLRDNTIKMRSIELERVKRNAAKMRPNESTKELEIKFAETKENFEKIQLLQDSIIKTYTTGEKINYSKISKLASDIRKRSVWLDENLFGAMPKETAENKDQERAEQKSVRDLIIDLDNAIGVFVKSAIFQDSKVVDSKISKAAQAELRSILNISNLLSIEAGKFR